MLLVLICFCFWSKGHGEDLLNNGKEISLWNNLKQADGMYRVPYSFADDLDNKTRDSATRTIQSLYSQTCIRFDPAEPGDPSIILFENGRGCDSFIGRRRGVSVIEGCRRYGHMLNAVMNALGFQSETLRLDRNQHLLVFLERMDVDEVPKMKPRTSFVQEHFNFSFDLNSVTQYGPDHQASGDEPTIYDILTGQPIIKNIWAFSLGDLERIRAAYNCSGVAGAQVTTTCYQRVNHGLLYRGNISETENGHRCQNWKAQYPNRHFLTPDRLTGSDLFKNRCRNPSMWTRPWCFTRNKTVRWEYCNVTLCNDSVKLPTPTPLVSVRGFWGQWSPYTRCSRTCDEGYMYSVRHCIGGEPESAECPGLNWRHEKCNYRNCTEHVWRNWGRWSDCDATCGSGSHLRTRTCKGLVGLDQCVGPSFENETCYADNDCPLEECYDRSNPQSYNGTVNMDRNGNLCWNWSNAKFNVSDFPSVDLDGNMCRNPDNRRNFPYCFVGRNRRSNCNVTLCNLKARWGNWWSWSACSASCGEGLMTRIRLCQKGDFGEGNCTGATHMSEACNATCVNGVPTYPEEELRVPTVPQILPPPPSGGECLSYLSPRAYRGTQNQTKSGLPCQAWDAASPWTHNYSDPDVIVEEGLSENYCRTPDPQDTHPWCFVDGLYPEREDCAIRPCRYNSTEQRYFYRLWVSFAESLGLAQDLI